uniref:Uncharacterized protein n=1 Tax=Cucumis melo TaxID=3656 RepID=A0A9I9E5B9_CUCME
MHRREFINKLHSGILPPIIFVSKGEQMWCLGAESGRASQKLKAYYGGSVDKKNSAPSTSQTHHEVTAYKGRPHYKLKFFEFAS